MVWYGNCFWSDFSWRSMTYYHLYDIPVTCILWLNKICTSRIIQVRLSIHVEERMPTKAPRFFAGGPLDVFTNFPRSNCPFALIHSHKRTGDVCLFHHSSWVCANDAPKYICGAPKRLKLLPWPSAKSALAMTKICAERSASSSTNGRRNRLKINRRCKSDG